MKDNLIIAFLIICIAFFLISKSESIFIEYNVLGLTILLLLSVINKFSKTNKYER